MLICGGPLYYLCRYVFLQLHTQRLGRLGVVYDQAGKARVIGITNYFIQFALKPVHDAIFNILKHIKHVDGTFDQHGVLTLLLEKPSEHKFYCFDLSAATDRLPVLLQRDILNLIFPGFGDK